MSTHEPVANTMNGIVLNVATLSFIYNDVDVTDDMRTYHDDGSVEVYVTDPDPYESLGGILIEYPDEPLVRRLPPGHLLIRGRTSV